jgi:F-type H+-transporting ATPase subunit gamma
MLGRVANRAALAGSNPALTSSLLTAPAVGGLQLTQTRGKASFADQKARIVSIQGIQKMTYAVYMIANAKVRAASERVDLARAFAKPFADLLPSDDPEPPVVKGEPLQFNTNNRGHFHLTVMTGDRGLCGAFNTATTRMALKMIENSEGRDDKLSLDVFGKKAAKGLLKRAGDKINRAFTDLTKLKVPTFTQAMMIAEHLASVDFDEGYVLYNRFKSVSVYDQVRVPQRSKAKDIEYIKKNMNDYMIEGDNDILENLIDFRTAALYWEYSVDSTAAEFCARANSMNGASTNTKDMIETLTIAMNRARQDKITKDLTELVAGVTAMEQ